MIITQQEQKSIEETKEDTGIVVCCGSSRQSKMRQTNSSSSSSSSCLLANCLNVAEQQQPSFAGNRRKMTSLTRSIHLSAHLLAYISIISTIVIISAQLTGAQSQSLGRQPDEPIASPAPTSAQDTNAGLFDGDTTGAKATDGLRNLRDLPLAEKLSINASNAFEFLLKKKAYSKYWTVEQKWDDLFKRFMAVQGTFKQMMMKSFMRDLEYYADITISPQCEQDLKFIQNYLSVNSRNMRWLSHMLDSTGKNEPGMLTGNLAHLGHVVQCIKTRAPGRPSNDSFDERYFELQTATLGERFRGKYCLASIRPVLPAKPNLISRFSDVLNMSLLSNISYTGESPEMLKRRSRQLLVPKSARDSIDRQNVRLDQIPFESELYEYLIMQRNFMYTLPRYMGVCYPSSCTQDDIRMSLQKAMDDQHQVVDIEFECEQEEKSSWQWFSTARLIGYVILMLFVSTSLLSSVARHILVDRLMIKRAKLAPNSKLSNLLATLELLSMDKCAGILFIKTKQASPYVDWAKVENNRSTTIDALKGFMMLMLIYSQMTMLGCLPVPFMWTKWADAMFPFYRSMITQVFLNTTIWAEGFYMISAYLIGVKLLENCRPTTNIKELGAGNQPNLVSFILKRYVRLVMPMVAFILMNYVWPRLSNGFVMQDQANKILAPCDSFGWTNMLMFHNHYNLNETCLWPSHVSASFFQLHLLSWPILLLCLSSFKSNFDHLNAKKNAKIASKLYAFGAFTLIGLLTLVGCVYPAWKASQKGLVVPFLIDYIDYDNYQRVIEWMVVPTYNHLASYMMGLALAYLVVKRRVDLEQRRASSSDWSGHYINRENSFESVRSSSTQELHSNAAPVLLFSNKTNHQDQQQHRLAKLNLYAPNQTASMGDLHLDDSHGSCLVGLFKTCTALLSLAVVLVSSWYWNGLGQPMSAEQTFVYVASTKLCFSLTFAYLFYAHFATRRNANNPWMITRFLVPIGRMSLMLFYMSWLVIWFDLLSSPFQWHPSHYFIGEKYCEIIFMSLVLSMFAYGAFEGTIKRVQYANRAERSPVLAAASGDDNNLFADQSMSELPTTINKMQAKPSKRFESFFHPANKKYDSSKPDTTTTQVIGSKTEQQPQPVSQSALSIGEQSSPGRRLTQTRGAPTTGAYLTTDARHLSQSDRYKLNAELRANYSFASIGLYESVGATGDLSHGGDPQVSPSSSHRRS